MKSLGVCSSISFLGIYQLPYSCVGKTSLLPTPGEKHGIVCVVYFVRVWANEGIRFGVVLHSGIHCKIKHSLIAALGGKLIL